MSRARVDDLDGSAGIEHGLDLLHRNGRQVGKWILLKRSRWADLDGILVSPLHRVPIDIAHERGNVCRCVCTEVEMIGVLIHIQRHDRYSAGDILTVIRRDLIDEATITRHVGEEHPAGAARQGACQGHELVAPPRDGAEIVRNRVGDRLGRLSAISSQTREVELMQERGVERGEFVALQALDDVTGRCAGIEGLELLRNRIQAIEGLTVIVFVVALDEIR